MFVAWVVHGIAGRLLTEESYDRRVWAGGILNDALTTGVTT